MSEKLPIVVLISGNGSNLQAIINAIERGLSVEIRAVISNCKDAYGLKRAKEYRIPTRTIPHINFSRDGFERILQETIDKYRPKFILLAGFMRKLSSCFVDYYKGRILNIHPSLLPKYPGLNTHARVLAAGDREHGVSVHYVTERLDGGPIICQARFFVSRHDTLKILFTRVQTLEHMLYPKVLSWIVTNRLILLQNNIVLFDKKILSETGKQVI
ncbi:phosphoribosylglycinamide formyltransferase [Coxiella endosymbiont of Amblyomma americanum]|uniref:phosphoribosylglycinamide formyltransferase n=1 Tax=Coxiella endosymbiont of Amblyomma americanum TaxID=325775 RepID=UPI00057E1F4F|nr:phosphoribosylglycinamide formyltransferase [Coxiella endosymbiont of Amblyomma americanum]AJC50206.1 phosphoribosylglycinamide formyltransferase [Coxiella endosymbiont of Amblyomma americanum]AUJ58567.1 phosphoribosylglycinamide formyltransferase [Coxiella-like endosymbiont of Amblyomma americanum]